MSPVPKPLSHLDPLAPRVQRVAWSPGAWQIALHEEPLAQQALDVLPLRFPGEIARDDVLALADQARSGNVQVATLFIASTIWGQGSAARYRPGMLRDALGEPSAFEWMEDCFQDAQTLSPQALFDRYIVEWPLKNVGTSFGSKFLYFCNYQLGLGPVAQALILDTKVARSLNDIDASFPVDASRFSSVDYGRYVDLATEWCADLGLEELDAIELGLFSLGER